MTDPIARSDELDARILEFPHAVPRRWVVDLSFVLLALMIGVGTTIMYVSLQHVTSSTNRAVRQEVPGLKKQIADRDQTIGDQQDELKQATAAIVKLAKQVQSLHGDPGTITIEPPKHPPTTVAGP